MPGEQVRREVLKTLLDHECESRFRHASPDGSIYRFVRPEVVVEVTCSDLQFEDSTGDFIRKWVIRHEEETWHPVIDANSVSLIHPIISRIRTDKLADGLDARVSQLEERVIAAAFAERVAPRLLPRSTMVRREVWTKASKTGTAVRKLLVWRTGKEAQWPGWPAWVVHFTDYSPDRKTPLERAFRTALTEDDAMAAAAEMVTLCAASGFAVHTFPTGQGNVIGNPILPVIKLTANPRTQRTMSEHIDVDVTGLLQRQMNMDEAGEALLDCIIRTADGELTAAELLGHREFSLTRLYESA
jgi:hypothetical protein